MKTTAEILRGLPYFSDLPQELLSRVCDASEQIDLDIGAVIIEEGTHSEEMYVVVSGELAVTKMSAGREVELGRIGPGDVVGEIALLDEAPRTATVTAVVPTHAIRVPVSAFEDLLSDSRVVRRMFRTVTSRLRGIEQTLRHEERMAALGKMAAQLMHELNNPAAAVARSTQELIRLQTELRETAMALSVAFGESTIDMSPREPSAMSALERSDVESAMAEWLETQGVVNPWELAPALIDAGWTRDDLLTATNGADPSLRPDLIRWLGLRCAVEQVVSELGVGARRIAELVRVVKEYSFVDRAPVLEIDVTSGLQDTLILLKHKLRNVEVVLDFQEDLPMVEVPGRDLNQVWTNLIDNAADAMADGGQLTVSAHNQGDSVVVTISDTGHGIPPDIVDKIFDPFFTTKEPGKGTGLGMHTVHSIIGRIGASIEVASDSSGTTFSVSIPAVMTPESN